VAERKIHKAAVDTRLLIFCILASSIFWLITTLSKSYENTIAVPIAYSSLPSDKTSTEVLPDSLYLRFEGLGWALFRSGVNSNRPISIDYSKINSPKLRSAQLLELVNRTLNSDINILELNPPEINFNFENKFEKKVPVTTKVDFTFAPLFDQVSPLKITPDSIFIYGPEEEVKKINQWEALPIAFKNINRNIQNTIGLRKGVNSNVTTSDSLITYTLQVEQFTEKKLQSIVKLINAPENREIVLLPKKVSITVQVPLSKYQSLKSEDFIITADFLMAQEDKSISLEIEKKPPMVKNVKISPAFVEFIIFNADAS